MTEKEISDLCKLDGLSRCLSCGKVMRHNVPRMGAAGGYVHADTGSFDCGPAKPLQWTVSTFAEELEEAVTVDCPEADARSTEELLAMAEEELKQLREQIVYCFYGDEIPYYIQGSAGVHELSDPVVASDLNHLVEQLVKQGDEIKALKEQLKGRVPAPVTRINAAPLR